MNKRTRHPQHRTVNCAWPRVLLLGLVLSLGLPGRSPLLPFPALTQSLTLPQADDVLLQGVEKYEAGQFAAAIALWQQALTHYRQLQQPARQLVVLERLGLATKALGDYTTAQRYYKEHLALAQTLGNRAAEANALANLGNVHQTQGRYGLALAKTQASLKLRRELGDRQGEGRTLTNLGNLQAHLGNYDQAVVLYQQSLAIAEALGDRAARINILNSLGALHAAEGQYDQARQSYAQGVAMARQLQQPLAVATLLGNLGSVYQVQGQSDTAIRYYQQSLDLAQKHQNRQLESSALAGLGLSYASQQNYPAAIAYQQKSLDLAQKLGDRLLEARIRRNLGDTHWQAGNLAAAETQLRQAIALLEDLRTDLPDLDQVSIFDTQRTNYSLLQQILIARQQPAAALAVAERGRARAFVTLLRRRLAASQGADSAVVELNDQPPTIDQIRQIARDQNATLVEYAIIPDDRFITQGKLKGRDIQLYIWVVSPQGRITFRSVDLQTLQQTPALTLAQLVTAARCFGKTVQCLTLATQLRGLGVTAKTGDTTAIGNAASTRGLRQLHHLLIAPIADLLPTDPNQRIIFIPHESLFLVPFPALQGPDDRYLVERHTILTAPSIQTLALTRQQQQQQRPTADAPLLIVGNPAMPAITLTPGDPPQPLPPLPGAEKEAQAIAQVLQTPALIGAQATETRILAQLPQARLIHLATHGLLEYGSPQQNRTLDIPGAIALAPSPQHDGLLTATELLDLRLQADLVVLSACDTGQGRITGDGVIGLSRALFSAGVPSVIVSLWAIPDAPTAELMVEFYRQRQNGLDKAQALRQAMLATKAKHPHPINWAAFTLIGEAE